MIFHFGQFRGVDVARRNASMRLRYSLIDPFHDSLEVSMIAATAGVSTSLALLDDLFFYSFAPIRGVSWNLQVRTPAHRCLRNG